jgi:APA family basic amino acid/polyamine antiporter
VRGIAGGVSTTAALTLWAFLGLECATIPSSSINDPSRTIPRATVTGTILASAIYILGTVGVMSVLTPAGLAASTAPYADAARRMGGETAARLVAIGAAISCFGALNGWTLMLGQLPLAVARDGVFPTVFARTSRSGVPVIGTLIGGVLTTLLIGLNFTRNLVGLFTFIILLSTLSTLIPYVFAALAVFVLPDRIDGRARPLTKGAAVTAGLAFVYSLWAIAGAGAETVYWGFILLIAGLPLYVRMMRRPPAPAAAPGVDDGVPSSVRASSTARAREASS